MSRTVRDGDTARRGGLAGLGARRTAVDSVERTVVPWQRGNG
jgi:hypothetical protein